MNKLNKLFERSKIKDKKGLQLKSAFFAVIVVGIILTSTGVLISNWNTAYDSGIVYDLDSYNKLDNVTATTEQYEQDISPTTPDTGQTFEGNILFAAYGVIGNILEPFRVVFGNGGMLSQLTTRWGIPDYIRQALVTMMILAFIFAIIAIIFRLKFITPGSSA